MNKVVVNLNRSKYDEVSMLQDVVNQVNNNISINTPLVDQTFEGEFNLSTNYQVYYNDVSLNETLTPTISDNPLIGAAARVVINADTSAALVAINLGTKMPESSDFAISKLNELIVYSLPEGIAYTIAILN